MIIDYIIILFLVAILIWSFWTLFRIIKYKSIVTIMLDRGINISGILKEYDTIVQYPWKKITPFTILDRKPKRYYIHPYNNVNNLLNTLIIKDFIVQPNKDDFGKYYSYEIWLEYDVNVGIILENDYDINQLSVFSVYLKNEIIISDELPLSEIVSSLKNIVYNIKNRKKLGNIK